MRRRLPFALLVVLLAVPAAARADWTAPTRSTPTMANAALFGLAAPGDVPAVLLGRRAGGGQWALELRTATRARGPLSTAITVATSKHSFIGASGSATSLGAVAGHGFSAAWLEIIGGVRRPVVATGPRLADRQVLTGAGSRSTQVLSYASDRAGDAVVAFWRYAGNSAISYEVLASYRKAGESFGTPQVVATGTPGFPVAAIGDDGAAAVGWSTPQGFAVSERLSRDGGAFGPAAVIPRSPSSGSALALAEGTQGRAVAAWTVRKAPGGVELSDRAAGSTSWSNPITLNTSAAPVRASNPPGLAFDGLDQTRVAWTEASGGKPSHDVVRYLVRRGPAWDPEPATIDPGIRGRTVTTRLVPSDSFARLGMVVASAFGTHRTVTATVRPDGTLGPKRTITWPSAGGSLAWTPFAAQGRLSTWLAFPRTNGIGRLNVALSRSR